VNLKVAQSVFERGSRLDNIDIVVPQGIANSPTQLDALKETLQAELGAKFTVAFPAATGESVSQAVSGLNTGLSFFSMIALFVGMLLIYNTFQMTVAERTREIGMLRSLGATKGQVLRLVLTEAVFLGLIGTMLGVAVGLVLSIPLVRMMGGMFGFALESFVIPTNGLVQAVIVGAVTTLVAAFLPAWQASRVAPTEALRARGSRHEGWLMRHSWQIGLVMVGVAALEGMGIISLGPGPQFFVLTFLGAILLMPSIILLFERGGRGIVGLIYGAMGSVGSRNLARSKARTSLTVGVLMIGVVLTVAMGAMSISFKAAIDKWVNAAIGGDFFITSSDPMREDTLHDILAVEGVSAATPQTLIFQKTLGATNSEGYTAHDDLIQLIGIDPISYRQVNSFQFVGGENVELAMVELAGGDAVFISSTLRDKWKVKDGDSVRLRTPRGERDFKIAATIVSFWMGGQTLTLSRRDIGKYYGDTRVNMFLVKKQPDVPSAQARADLDETVGRSKRVDVMAADEFRSTLVASMQQTMSLFDAMIWIAVIISALGVINTMTMNVLERVREIGTLRSIGTTRGQLARMILSESGAMGLLGSIFGVAVAVPVSFVMVEGMKQGSGFQMEYIFPLTAFITGVIVALVISQLAALYPTWRAGRINIIEAIREE
jgi:putative ABC transport system permease protein